MLCIMEGYLVAVNLTGSFMWTFRPGLAVLGHDYTYISLKIRELTEIRPIIYPNGLAASK